MLWPLRPVQSARHSIEPADGRAVVTIEHAPLPGVTPEMLGWWYGHVPGTMRYAGAVWPRYLVWHPLDHISYRVERPGPAGTGSVRAGTRLAITEALGRDPRMLLDIRVAVEEVSAERAVVAKRVAGTAVVRLENEFHKGPDGARYTTRLSIGDTTVLGRLLLNRVARTRAFPPRKILPWIRHHVEEVGNLEHFLPDLFRKRADHEQ